MFKLKTPGVGFYLSTASLVFTIVGFILYFTAISAFNYDADRFVVALTIIALWSILFLIINSLFNGDKPFWSSIFYVIVTFALCIGFACFLTAFLSPIGVFFTVNMGDMETYAIGVPRCIAGVVFYVLALLMNIVASFFNPIRNEKEEQ